MHAEAADQQASCSAGSANPRQDDGSSAAIGLSAGGPAGEQGAAGGESAQAGDVGLLDDEPEVGEANVQRGSEADGAVAPHPLDGVSDASVRQRVSQDLPSLGSMSIGLPHKGSLVNAVAMPEDKRWVLVDKAHAWGTQETVDFLVAAISKVYDQFPEAPPLNIGHLSGRRGGFLRPHRSHQSGRDVDLGFYYQNGGHWYLRADETSLDRERTWALVRSLITETDVRFILIDHSIQKLLRTYAESIGEDKAWLDDVFTNAGPNRFAIIRHARGHSTHMHVRFYNPIAQETARRSYPSLVALKMIKPPQHYLSHRVKKGETLIHLAKRYGTSVASIKRANGLRSSKIFARKTYKIPRTGPASAGPRAVIPKRRLPPKPAKP